MPIPQASTLHLDPPPSFSLDALRQSLLDLPQPQITPAQSQSLAEIRQLRDRLANPLNPAAERPPNPQERQRISGRTEVAIALSDPANPTVRLGPDLISVAIALSDELYINELDAGVLLYEARTYAAHRPDHDVVLAAKDLFYLRRREIVVYLQEILRAGLSAGMDSGGGDEENFVTALMRERDLLVIDHNLLTNVQRRLVEGVQLQNRQNAGARNPNALQKGEAVLLAEILFLLAYTVQLTSAEALSLKVLLDVVDGVFEGRRKEELEAKRAMRAPSFFGEGEKKNGSCMELMSTELVEIESVRNLVLLAWTCALDRSRYHDVYDPRTGLQGVNLLLKDLDFVSKTIGVPKLDENEAHDKVSQMSGVKAAAELCAAVFRLAVAEPDQDEALLTALRVSAYGGALSFLAEDLADWIGERAGSLCPDTDLYADVVEDLALDVAEAPQLVPSLIQFTQNDVQIVCSENTYSSIEGNIPTPGRLSMQGSPAGPRSIQRANASLVGDHLTPSGNRRASTTNMGLHRRPPKPPSARNSARPPSSAANSLRSSFPAIDIHFEPVHERSSNVTGDIKHSFVSKENLTASLAKFVAKAVSLAPSKLNSDSHGGLRYLSGIAPSNVGLIQQIGDAVIDLWDVGMRNPYASCGSGEAFQEAQYGLLALLASLARKEGTPSHASASLRFLRDSGQTAVSIDKVSEALKYYANKLSSSMIAKGVQLEVADSNTLRDIVKVVANAAETLRPHGGALHLLGEVGKELAMRMASLAIHDISPSFKDTLLKALSGLDNRRAISLFLESMASDNCTPLRRFLRGTESPTGVYSVTISVLSLTTQTVSWGNDEFPEAAVESITIWFATEEVLAFWGRRKYSVEAHRWEIVREAAQLITGFMKRNPESERSYRVLARLLTPAPGTGTASFALRTLACAAGLMRVGHDQELAFSGGFGEFGGHDKYMMRLYQVTGREALVHAAEHGLGDTYRGMQQAAQVAARLVSLLFSVPSGRLSVPGIVVAPIAELLVGEVRAISSTATLVFAVNGFIPSIAKAGYSQSVCAAVLGMLAKAAQESAHIAGILARDDFGRMSSAAEFRSSLASIISRSTTEAVEHEGIHDNREHSVLSTNELDDPPIMISALRVVEACLGEDGGSAAGLFLLGLQLDSSGFYVSAEYGVLGALVELVAGAYDASGRMDNKCKSTAAVFLERLAANTVRRTSVAVLEHLKEAAGPNDPSVRGGGFADEMLFRILEAVGLNESAGQPAIVDWYPLGELLMACLSLSALQVRMFPNYELERCTANRDNLFFGSGLSMMPTGQSSALPSPIDLLKLLASIAGSGEVQIAFEAMRTWAHLLGTRLGVHERNTGYSSVPMLFELITILLGSIAGVDGEGDLSALVKKDGGEMASSIVLLCIARMRDCDNPHEPGSEEYIGDVQCTALLGGVIRALAAVVGYGANAARARTSLYSALLICGSLCKGRVSDDAIGRAYGGRHGPRQVSGAEAVISVACADAVSGPSPAARAVAMAAASMTTILDPVRSAAAFGTQNRLKKVMHSTLADQEIQKLVIEACEKEASGYIEMAQQTAHERAAIVVVEAAIALIHAVSSTGQGARVTIDSSFLESAGGLLKSMSSQRLSDRDDREIDIIDVDDRGLKGRRNVGGEMMDVQGTTGNDVMDDSEGLIKGTQIMEIGEMHNLNGRGRWLSIVASVTGAMAAVICCANGAVVARTVAALHESKDMLAHLLHSSRSFQAGDLEAVGNIGVIISRIPYELVSAAGTSTNLRMSLASVVCKIIPKVSKSYQIGSSGSLLSAGCNLKRAENEREARRMRINHPEGGSLSERDLMQTRAVCAQNVFAALRYPVGLLFLFSPNLTERTWSETRGVERASLRTGGSGATGRLSEVARICSTALSEMQRSAEESMQIDTRVAGETGSSISSRRISELAAFCQEEYGIESGVLNGRIVIECLKKSSAKARAHADRCLNIFESTLFMLREYVRTAREAMDGKIGPKQGLLEEDNSERGVGFDLDVAESLLSDAKKQLVPICKEVEGLAGGVWGDRDSSFCKQLCRQIRTACTGRG